MLRLPPGDHLLSLSVNGQLREYLVRIPPGDDVPRAAILLFHGTGGTVRWTQDEAKFAPFADRQGIVAVYPQGLPPDPAQPSRFISNPPAWNRPEVDDVAFIRALLDDLPRHAPIDSTRVYATGFSNGATMVFRLAAEMPHAFAAVAPVAGYCRTSQGGRVPMLYVIGADDPMVPPLGGQAFSPWLDKVIDRPAIREQLAQWASWIGNKTTPEVLWEIDGDRRERFPGPVPFEVLTIAGLGHHWPGGRGQLKKKLAGLPSDRIDGNAVIWEFLREFRLNSA